MEYSDYIKLFKNTVPDVDQTIETGTLKLQIRWFPFRSTSPAPTFSKTTLSLKENNELQTSDDSSIEENYSFRFPVIQPLGMELDGKAILLLHGLNERSWTKYWSWAATLAERLNRPVILFPISFHINRAPKLWSNPRTINSLMNSAKNEDISDKTTSFANFTLSKRLINNPLRFMSSGFQSAIDIQQLVKMLKKGEIIGLDPLSKIDIFAYSIGAFLAQILLIADPKPNSGIDRLFMFCGGAPFREMNGVSKLIMNKVAFERIYQYYLTDSMLEIAAQSPLGTFLSNHPLGKAFNAMISPDREPILLKYTLSIMKQRIEAVTLRQDLVIPSKPTINLLVDNGISRSRVTEMDFTFPYTHENPFPVFSELTKSLQVDQAFKQIFRKAEDFLKH